MKKVGDELKPIIFLVSTSELHYSPNSTGLPPLSRQN
ncbi:hypothetical protein IAD21_04774 [Abditibacteriota bacterium]|nr:hypothetical protein IAD21_04774 [Abditibacteriota bacterium]